MNGSNTLFTAVSTAGNAVFLSGQTVVQYQLSTGAQPAVVISSQQGSSLFGSSIGPARVRELITDTGAASNFAADYAGVVAARSPRPARSTPPSPSRSSPACRRPGLHQPADPAGGDQHAGAAAADRGADGGGQLDPWGEAAGVLRQPRRLGHPRLPEHHPAEPAGQGGACDELFRRGAVQHRRHRPAQPGDHLHRPRTSAAPSRPTATAPTTPGAATT